MGRKMLTDEERAAVAAAVAEAEQETGGEIATAIIPESDDYGFRELLAAVVVGIVTYGVLTLFAPVVETTMARVFWTYSSWMLPTAIGGIAMLVGGLTYFLAQIPAIDRLIVPKTVMVEAVGRRARRHFMESGAYDTRDRTGVLVFVSLLERRVELIADRGITERVEQERWDAIVADLTEGIATGNAGVALAEAVRSVGKILGDTVERRHNDTNELPDGPTELERGS
ncbi:MAG: TPM domain-containing protein [Spirochaeta sp.]|jgi:putative membrane protein|nr:TPM domain-containing protein [Spirochaeta sp.]